MRKILSVNITDINKFKQQLLLWSSNYKHVTILDSNDARTTLNSIKEYNTYDLLAGVGCLQQIELNENCFETLQHSYNANKDWWFGFFSYDIKNELEDLKSSNIDGLKMPSLHFFCPKWVFILNNSKLEIHYQECVSTAVEAKLILDTLLMVDINDYIPSKVTGIKSRICKQEYIDAVIQLKEHIRKGDIYEVNFCQEFYANNVNINPLDLYRHLTEVSPTPYACYYHFNDKYLMCASPERFLKKINSKIISQPIKGTAKRGNSHEHDNILKTNLINDAKERAENIMIVDLVRNDLSRTAANASVQVEELCAIYSFPMVHQMISTIVSQLDQKSSFFDCIKSCFPMGSMTGAPKVRAMKLIEQYESTKRGLFSGAVGYISPNADFDFNVVIRSIQYNSSEQYLSFMVGSAITMLSVPEREYDECLLKAKAIKMVLGK